MRLDVPNIEEDGAGKSDKTETDTERDSGIDTHQVDKGT